MINFTILGNITKDVEAKQIGESYVYNISLAINRKYKNEDQTTFVNVNYWSKTDKLAQYLTKGKKIAVSGNWYENREHEGKYYQTFYANDLAFAGGNNDGNVNAKPSSGGAKAPINPAELLEDEDELNSLPF